MSFTVDDYHDLVRLVQQHPEWKSELRQLLLSDELLELPGPGAQACRFTRTC